MICMGRFPVICEWMLSCWGMYEMIFFRSEQRRFEIEKTITAWAGKNHGPGTT